MIDSPIQFSNELAVGILTVSNLLLLGTCIAGLLWSTPEDVTKSNKKMSWHVTTVEKEHIDKETRLENLKIRDWNPFIKQERIIENPTYDDVLRHCPHITFKAKSPIQGESEEIVSSFTHEEGDTWVMDDVYRGWNGDPVNAEWEKGSTALFTLSRPIRITPTPRVRFGIIASVTRSSSKKKARITSIPACANSSIPSSM